MLKTLLLTLVLFLTTSLFSVATALSAPLEFSLASISLIAQTSASSPAADNSKSSKPADSSDSDKASQNQAPEVQASPAPSSPKASAPHPAPSYNMKKIEKFNEDVYGD